MRDSDVKIAHVYSLIKNLTGMECSDPEIEKWLHSENVALGMDRPVDLINRGEFDVIIRKLTDIITSAH